MGDILRFFTILLLIAIVLLFLIPIGWVVWQLFVLILGDYVFILGDIFIWILIIVGFVLLIKWIFD